MGGIVCLTVALTACGKATPAAPHDAGVVVVATASAAPRAVASAPVDAGPCKEAIVQPGRCVPEAKHWREKAILAWFEKYGVTDAASVQMLESEGSADCEELTLGAQKEPALACVRLDPHPVLPKEGDRSPFLLDLVLDVLAARGGRAVRAAAIPVGVQSSAGPIVFSMPWTIDAPGMAVDLSPPAADCKAAAARLAKFWSTQRGGTTDAFAKRAMEAEEKAEGARVAALCAAPKHHTIK